MLVLEKGTQECDRESEETKKSKHIFRDIGCQYPSDLNHYPSTNREQCGYPHRPTLANPYITMVTTQNSLPFHSLKIYKGTAWGRPWEFGNSRVSNFVSSMSEFSGLDNPTSLNRLRILNTVSRDKLTLRLMARSLR